MVKNATSISRDPVYDIMKGIMIILVVIGHNRFANTELKDIIFWFHMPVFFMITGILSKWGGDFNSFFKRRAVAYLLPYLCWSFIAYIVFPVENPMKFLCRVLYAGKLNSLLLTFPMWYINCLFVSSMFFKLLHDKKFFLVLIGLIWVFGHVFNSYLYNIALPWSIETVPFVLFYFVVAKFDIDLLKKSMSILIISSISIVGVTILYFLGIYEYHLNMKDTLFPSITLDIIIPLSFFNIIYYFCRMLNTIPYVDVCLSNIGKSLVIFFTHAIFMYVLSELSINNSFVQVVLIVISGMALYYLLSKTRISSFLFLGKKY